MTREHHLGEDRLLDLAHRLLDDRDRSAALDHLRDCSPCARAFREIAALHERAPGKQNDVLVAEPVGRVLTLSGGRRWRPLATLMAAAAVLAAVFFGSEYLRGRHDRALEVSDFAWLPDAEPTVLQRDSIPSPADERLIEGLRAYHKHDARRARTLLAGARASGPLEEVRRIYLGSSELQLGRAGDALRTLGAVDLRELPEPWRSETEWTIALANEATGHRSSADSIWRNLSSRTGPIGERARRKLITPGSER